MTEFTKSQNKKEKKNKRCTEKKTTKNAELPISYSMIKTTPKMGFNFEKKPDLVRENDGFSF